MRAWWGAVSRISLHHHVCTQHTPSALRCKPPAAAGCLPCDPSGVQTQCLLRVVQRRLPSRTCPAQVRHVHAQMVSSQPNLCVRSPQCDTVATQIWRAQLLACVVPRRMTAARILRNGYNLLALDDGTPGVALLASLCASSTEHGWPFLCALPQT